MFMPSTARLDAAAAVHREDREHRTGIDVGNVRLDARHCGEHIAVAANGRQIPHGLVVECDCRLGALDIDDGRLTRDRDRLRHAADLHVRVDLDDAGA
jgi:hypothetical protein